MFFSSFSPTNIQYGGISKLAESHGQKQTRNSREKKRALQSIIALITNYLPIIFLQVVRMIQAINRNIIQAYR
ncbi:hypothetical protein GCM10007941_10440 [Amphritea balenae]|nr:hypothetical protein GCM10007941_10440 [Amphritea balenae]